MFTKFYYVYLLASRRNGTLYVGVTNDVVRRVGEHREHVAQGFKDLPRDAADVV